METVRLFGMPVAKVTRAEAVDRIVAIARERYGAGTGGRGSYFVATINVDFVCNAVRGWPFRGDRELWGYLKGADFVVADGMPLVLLSRLLRDPLPERVTGSDMVPELCARFAEEGLPIYVLGGTGEALDAALAKLREKSPSLKLAGSDHSRVSLDDDPAETVGRINAAKPAILFVALGNPKEELWMGRNAASLDVPVMIGIGGSFNFIAGRVKRAPRWMQRAGLEWIYRICQEPGRLWRRYAYGLFKFSWLSLLTLCGAYREKK